MFQIKLPGAKNTFYLVDCTEQKTVQNELANTYYPYAIDVPHPSQINVLDLLIHMDAHTIRAYRTMSKKPLVEINCPTQNIAYKTIIRIIRENLILEKNFTFIHGAAVVIKGQTCLFLAQTYTGKSTIGVYQDFMGNTCLSDDLCIIDKTSLQIYPISKYAHIREEGLFLFQNNIDCFRYNKLLSRYEYLLSKERFSNNYFVNCTFSISREQNIETYIKLSEKPQECFLDNMFLPYQVKNNIFSSLNLIGKMKVYDVNYTNMSTITKLVVSVLA